MHNISFYIKIKNPGEHAPGYLPHLPKYFALAQYLASKGSYNGRILDSEGRYCR